MLIGRKILVAALATTAILSWSGAALSAEAIPETVAAAVADPGRPPWEIKTDADRKPAEVTAFTQLQRGGTIADFMPGYGYYTRIFAKIVGPKGRVYAIVPGGGGGNRQQRQAQREGKTPSIVPDELAQACVRGCYEEGMAPYMLPVDHMLAIQNISEYNNMRVLWEGNGQFALPEQVDAAFSANGYHDLHTPAANGRNIDVAKLNLEILHALKPGGVYVVSDNVANAGADPVAAGKLQRSDPDSVKAELTSAGFTFDGESQALSNEADNHSSAANDKTMRNKSDRYVMRFRKPESMVGDKRPPKGSMDGYYGNTAILDPGSMAGGAVEGPRERRMMYHPDGTYQEEGVIGKGPGPMQSGLWYWDAEGRNCMLHEYPLDERQAVVCHDTRINVKAGDKWGGPGQEDRLQIVIEGLHPQDRDN